MEYWSIVLFSILISALGVCYLFKIFNFFKRHSIIHIPPIPIFGVMAPVIFLRMLLVDVIGKIYNFNRDAKYIGFHAMTKPVILLRDLELVKAIFVKNFDTFSVNPIFIDLNEHVFTQSLFALRNTEWRNIRNLLSSFFTSNKMKAMFILMSNCAADFTELISTLPADKSDVNITDISYRYANDVIALCYYGIKIDSIRDPTNKFYTCGKEITHMSPIRSMKYIFIRSFPKLARILNVKLLNNQEMKYFESIIKNEIAVRDAKHITRPDMIHLLLNNRDKEVRIQLDIDDIVAQAYLFYFAGFETTSSTMSFIMYKIATTPSVQIKLRQEIDTFLEKSNGNVTYEVINQLKYLDAVIKETLRYYSPPFIERMSEKAYELPPALPGEKSFTINKGTIIWVPFSAIHHDEKYYDNPKEFRPERFLNNDHDSNHQSPFFAFGMGPRMCMGPRFSTLMIKIMLFYLLARCELKHCTKTLSIKFNKKSLVSKPEGGFWLNIQCRNDVHPAVKTLQLNDFTNF